MRPGGSEGIRPEVVVYTRSGCHLCEVVEAQLAHLRELVDFTCRVVDVDGEPALRARYGDQVPVVTIDGRKAFKYRVREGDFLRKLQEVTGAKEDGVRTRRGLSCGGT